MDAAFIFSKYGIKDMDESAMVDGVQDCRPSGMCIIPEMWPGVITTGLFSFLLAYNDFAITSMLLSTENQTMVPRIAIAPAGL